MLKIIASEQRVTKYLLKLRMFCLFHPYWLLVHTEPACSTAPHCFPLSWVEDLKWALWGQMHWAAGLKTDLISMECFEIEIFFFSFQSILFAFKSKRLEPCFSFGGYIWFIVYYFIMVILLYYVYFILFY